MDEHDEFEVAIERRLHGTLDPNGAAELERHLATCAACREYEASARQTEGRIRDVFAAHSDSVDWRKVQAGARRSLGGYRRAIFLGPAAFALVMFAQFLSKLPAGGPRWGLLAVYGVFVPSYCALMAIVLRSVLQRREAESARLGALPFYRVEIDRAIRRARWRRWFMPLCGLVLIALVWTNRNAIEIWFAAIINPIALATAVYAHFVQLPRLRREREDCR